MFNDPLLIRIIILLSSRLNKIGKNPNLVAAVTSREDQSVSAIVTALSEQAAQEDEEIDLEDIMPSKSKEKEKNEMKELTKALKATKVNLPRPKSENCFLASLETLNNNQTSSGKPLQTSANMTIVLSKPPSQQPGSSSSSSSATIIVPPMSSNAVSQPTPTPQICIKSGDSSITISDSPPKYQESTFITSSIPSTSSSQSTPTTVAQNSSYSQSQHHPLKTISSSPAVTTSTTTSATTSFSTPSVYGPSAPKK